MMLLGLIILTLSALVEAQGPITSNPDYLRIPYEYKYKRSVYRLINMTGKTLFDSPPNSLNENPIPYEKIDIYEQRIRVIFGNGHAVFELRPQSTRLQSALGPYTENSTDHDPDIHPNQQKIACIRCEKDTECKVIEFDLSKNDSGLRVVYAPPLPEPLDSPAWSPDGSHLAFLIGKDLAILETSSGTFQRIIGADKSLDASARTLDFWERDYIRWGADGKQIFLWAKRLGPDNKEISDIAQIDIYSMQIKWLSLYGIEFANGKYKTRRVYEDGKWYSIKERLPDIEAIRALFGSSDNPVLRPLWSPDRRYYFYRTQKEGLKGKGWIERYDTQTQETKVIKTLWRHPYME